MSTTPYRSLSILFSVTAVIALVVCTRLAHEGIWFPDVPQTIGNWSATEVPLTREALAQLGAPPANGFRYTNPFSERVDTNVISTITYAAYHDPPICMSGYGYEMTAEKILPVFGPDTHIRAMILKSDTDGQRILMYSWIQNKDGSTDSGKGLTLHSDIKARFTVGANKTFTAEPSCIIRAYIQIHPADRFGLQARRNLNQVCQGIYDALKADGRRS